MKGFKFKTLTMRIWATFTIVILLITLCLSTVYICIFRYMDVKAKTQDLINAHNLLLESDFDNPLRFDALRNLRGVFHFTYSGGIIYDIGRPPTRTPPMRNINTGNPASQFDDHSIRSWMIGFAEPNMLQTTFYRKFENTKFIFTISLMDNGAFFISYMPNSYDNTIVYYTFIIGAVFILVGFITAKIVANYISKPLSKLESFTRKIAAKDWNEPIILKNDDEIGRLAISMNKMQEALKRADEDEKKFLQSISHDLKTPVMVIMSHADAILDGVYVDTLDRTAQIIKDEAIRLNVKIKHLLYLNTLDYVLHNQAETHAVRLDEILKRIVEKFEVLRSDIRWDLVIQPVEIKTDEEKLTVAIENILDNAVRYAESEIVISVKKEKNCAHIEIFNDGGHIKPESLNKIFRSLYKDKTGNFGLGLAISKKIIAFFGGSIFAENKEKGVSFIINYPLE